VGVAKLWEYFTNFFFQNKQTILTFKTMKNYLLIAIWGVICCSCCSSSNYFVSPNAHSLFDSYRDIIDSNNVFVYTYLDKDSTHVSGNRNYVASAMTAKGYNEQKPLTPGYLTFMSFNWSEYKFLQEPNRSNKEATAFFTTQWVTDTTAKNEFAGCKECLPKPNVFPQNFKVGTTLLTVLVPVSKYQSSGILDIKPQNTGDGYIKGPLLDLAISTNDIKAINDIYIEGDGEYMSKKLTTNYNDTHSSVGLICEVLLKSGKPEKCYIFNTQDGETLTWKVKKEK
jgi:hypothetical protein